MVWAPRAGSTQPEGHCSRCVQTYAKAHRLDTGPCRPRWPSSPFPRTGECWTPASTMNQAAKVQRLHRMSSGLVHGRGQVSKATANPHFPHPRQRLHMPHVSKHRCLELVARHTKKYHTVVPIQISTWITTSSTPQGWDAHNVTARHGSQPADWKLGQ